jgi:hypothetical protein
MPLVNSASEKAPKIQKTGHRKLAAMSSARGAKP